MTRLPKVSVCVVTYNQEKYIGECLQSILKQDCDFDFEIIVGVDKSSDKTRVIVEEFARDFPNIIRPIYHEENIGPTKNYLITHMAARGDFVAHLDGDDVAYKDKLKTQLHYLENNPAHVLVWHRVKIFDDQGNENYLMHHKLQEVIDVQKISFFDLLKYGSLGAASSLMYKKNAGEFLKKINGEVLDYYIALNILKSGMGARLDNFLGGYRVNIYQATTSKSKWRYFKESPMRALYAKHLNELFRENENNKEMIFLNACIHFLVEMRFLRITTFYYLLLLFRTFSLKAILKIPSYFSAAIKIRSR